MRTQRSLILTPLHVQETIISCLPVDCPLRVRVLLSGALLWDRICCGPQSVIIDIL